MLTKIRYGIRPVRDARCGIHAPHPRCDILGGEGVERACNVRIPC